MPRRPLALLALAAGLAGSADPLPEHARTVVEYDIDVRLDAAAKRLQGHERVAWHNPSGDAVGELWLHLYLNAFRNSESTFYRESGGRVRGDTAEPDSWGAIDLSSLRLADGADLLPGARFEHPDDDNAQDRTVLRVPLPRPVPPGGSVELEAAFEARLPRVYARTGHHGDFFAVAQWFPKLGVYEPAGLRGRATGGWNCHQFHANSEFYADYGRYKVAITLPARFVLGATGRRVERRVNPDGSATHVYEQADVHDFAWAADPRFVEVRRRFVAAEQVTDAEYQDAARRLGRPLEELRLSDVELILLMQPGHLPQLERQAGALVQALKHFGLWYGRYPYETLTMIDPAPRTHGASGVEYPTLFFAGTSFLFGHWPLDRMRFPEDVVVHEFGHQHFYGLVGSNEFEEPWLDEGFNTYATARLMDQLFGPDRSAFELPGWRLGQLELGRLPNRTARSLDVMRAPAWKFPQRQYGLYAYARPALTLRTLEGQLGATTLARVLRTYAERWRFGHPGSADFYAVAREVSGQDLRPFFEQVAERSGALDYAVGSLSSEAVEPRGLLIQDGREVTVDEAEADRRKGEAERAGRATWLSQVELLRLGEISVPVEVELRFAGQPPERRYWDGRERRVRWEFRRPERLLAVDIDPERRLALDTSFLNNSRRTDPDARAAAHWGVRFLFWVQQALALLAL